MWSIGPDALQALGGSYQLSCSAAASRGGVTLKDKIEIGAGAKWVEEWNGSTITSSVTIPTIDPLGDLLTSSLESPLAPFGQRLVVSAILSVNGLIIEQTPLGTFRIEDPGPGDEQWHRYSNGRWVPQVNEYTVQATDLLGEVGDNELLQDFVPSGTTYSDSVRLLDGLVPMGPWVVSKASPAGTWQDSRIAALAALADLEGCVPAMSRVGSYLPRSTALKQVPDWTLVLADQGATLARFRRSASSAGIKNAVMITGEDADQRPTRGVAYTTSGPLAWGGPFGRRTLKEQNPLARTDALASSMAAGRLASLQAKLTVPITVVCAANPGLEALDTVGVPLPEGKTLTGLATKIELPLDGSDEMTVTAAVPWRQVWTG